MERVTGSKGLAVAVLVSLIIHGGILLAYAFVFKDAGMFKNYQPLMVALILPSELRKPAALPLTLAEKEKSRFSKEAQRDPRVPVDLIKDAEEAPPKEGVLAAKAGGEVAAAGAPHTPDQAARDFTSASLTNQKFQSGPEIDVASDSGEVAAYLPPPGPSTGKAAGSGINSQGSPKVADSGGEMSWPGYAKLETSRGGALTSAAPRYNENNPPAYPSPARRRGYAGVVMLSVEVLADGRVGRLEIKKTSGYDLLDKSARETVKGWKFSPGKKMGTPVTMWVDVPVRFELN